MRYIILSVLVLSTLNYEINSTPMEQEEEREEPATLTEQEEERQNPAEKLKLQLKKNPTKTNLEDELFFPPVFTALPLDTVFSILLKHTAGAGLLGSVSTVFGHMFSAGGLAELAFSLILAASYKWKREKAELVKENAELVKENAELVKENAQLQANFKLQTLNKEKDHDEVVTTLMEVKTELKNQMDQLLVLLEDVERKREVNKQKLQAVEAEITEKERQFDKPEELLKEKENLLQDQWKLDQIKKDNEKQLLNTERLLEPIEILVSRIQQRK